MSHSSIAFGPDTELKGRDAKPFDANLVACSNGLAEFQGGRRHTQ